MITSELKQGVLSTTNMVKIPRLQFTDDDEEEAHPLGIRALRKSGGSVVITIPPEVINLVDVDVGDEMVIHAASDTISLTKLPEQD